MAEAPPPRKRSLGQRRLAAIMFTDVVSFSARTEESESLTLRLVKRDFQVITNACTAEDGQVLKTTGDGLLMSFPTAGAAVGCALKVQKQLVHAAKTMPPEQVLQHRIGIHLGDVFVSDQDVMGNDVNVAARVLSEAGAGEICVSQTVYDVVKHRLSIKGIYLGEREMKNIREPVPIFKLPATAEELKADQVRSARPRKLIAITAALLIVAGGVLAWTKFREEGEAALPAIPDEPATPATQPLVLQKSGQPVARFVGAVDRGGDWKGTYGKTAALVFGDFPPNLPLSPMQVALEKGAAPMTVSVSGATIATVPVQRAALPGAPQRVSSNERVASGLIGNKITLRLDFPDNITRRITIYSWFPREPGKGAALAIVDPKTEAVLAGKRFTKSDSGTYVSFDVAGSVNIVMQATDSKSKISGLFIDPVPQN